MKKSDDILKLLESPEFKKAIQLYREIRFEPFKGTVAFYTTLEGASARIRMLMINETFQEMGMRSELYQPGKRYDVIITGRVYGPDHINQIREWKKQGTSVYNDMNEDVLEFAWVKETLMECDYIVACSASLADKIHVETGKPCAVIEDAVEFYTQREL